MKKTAIKTTLALTFSFAAMGAHAVAVNTGDVLHITTGEYLYDPDGVPIGFKGGSYFGMDISSDARITYFEKAALAEGTTGLVIGTTTARGANHSGVPVYPDDTNAIDLPWNFFGNTGSDYLRVAVTGDTTNGLNMSGWTVTWNNVPAIDMGGGAWQPLNCDALGCTGHTFTNGVARFQWDGVYGHNYILDYSATVPRDGLTNFGGVLYYLHLEGVVQAVPIPATAWLFGSVLLGLIGIARRKNKK